MEGITSVERALRSGEATEREVEILRQAIQRWEERQSRQMHDSLNIGDIVRYVNLGMGAKYMNGLRARVTGINFKTVWVETLPEDRARVSNKRLGAARRLKVYPSNLELAYVEGQSSAPLEKLVSGPPPIKNVSPDFDEDNEDPE